jgi:hypothetical protein
MVTLLGRINTVVGLIFSLTSLASLTFSMAAVSLKEDPTSVVPTDSLDFQDVVVVGCCTSSIVLFTFVCLLLFLALPVVAFKTLGTAALKLISFSAEDEMACTSSLITGVGRSATPLLDVVTKVPDSVELKGKLRVLLCDCQATVVLT